MQAFFFRFLLSKHFHSSYKHLNQLHNGLFHQNRTLGILCTNLLVCTLTRFFLLLSCSYLFCLLAMTQRCSLILTSLKHLSPTSSSASSNHLSFFPPRLSTTYYFPFTLIMSTEQLFVHSILFRRHAPKPLLIHFVAKRKSGNILLNKSPETYCLE